MIHKTGIIYASGDEIGENLVLNSANKAVSHLTSGNEYICINLGQSYMNIPSGSQVTISFDIELKYLNNSDSATYDNYFLVYNTNNKGPKQIKQVGLGSAIYDGETIGTIIKKRVSGTTTIVDRESPTIQDNYIEFYTGYGSGNVFSISNLKIELGSQATPWIMNENDWGFVGNDHGFIERFKGEHPMSVYEGHYEMDEIIEY